MVEQLAVNELVARSNRAPGAYKFGGKRPTCIINNKKTLW